jgi:hypothetical protein
MTWLQKRPMFRRSHRSKWYANRRRPPAIIHKQAGEASRRGRDPSRPSAINLETVEGDKAFVVFQTPGAKLCMMGLINEGRRVEDDHLDPSVLVPAL